MELNVSNSFLFFRVLWVDWEKTGTFNKMNIIDIIKKPLEKIISACFAFIINLLKGPNDMSNLRESKQARHN